MGTRQSSELQHHSFHQLQQELTKMMELVQLLQRSSHWMLILSQLVILVEEPSEAQDPSKEMLHPLLVNQEITSSIWKLMILVPLQKESRNLDVDSLDHTTKLHSLET